MLLIDKREKSSLLDHVKTLCNNRNKPYDLVWLEIGDYVIQTEPSICIEAKSTADFLQSVRNKRVFNQIDNMDREYDENFIIIYGNLDEAVSYLGNNTMTLKQSIAWRNKMKSTFVGALSSISIHTDIKPIWVENHKVAANIIAAIYENVDKKLIIQKELPKKIRTDDVRIDILTQIKGISIEKAKQLLKEFGSIAELTHVKIEDLYKIEGIGKAIANNILKALKEEKEVKY